MTFERLVRDTKFVSEIATTAVGRLKLDRPTAVVTANARVRLDKTEKLLGDAHSRAITEGTATLIHGLAVPFSRLRRRSGHRGQARLRRGGPGDRQRWKLADHRRRQGLRTRALPNPGHQTADAAAFDGVLRAQPEIT
ncbi:hypothetical protein [Nocardia nova]